MENPHRESFIRACKAAAKLSRRLLPIVGPVDTAGAMIAAAADTLREEIGQLGTVEYLREFATEVENDNGVHLQ